MKAPAYADVTRWLAAVAQLAGVASDAPEPVAWAERVSGAELDPWQQALMRSEHPALLLLTSRQVGKSHVVSLRAAYRAKYRRRRVAILSPTLRQSGLVYRKAKHWLQVDRDTTIARSTLTELEVQGGGAILSLPGDRPDLAIRGETLDDLIVDEASRIKDELIVAASPTIATRPDANITYLSSPAGCRGAFYRAWQGESWWERVQVMANECPRISAAFLDRERARLGPLLFGQEYECKFVASVGGVFDPAALDDAFAGPALPAESCWLPELEDDTAARAWL